MSELEDKLNAVLGNPQMMQQIMALAQSMNQPSEQASQPSAPAPVPASPIDMGLLQKLSGLAQQSKVDPNQQELLHALSHYLSRSRVEKLEKAMRAAKLTELATALIDSGALQGLLGR